MRQKKKKEKRKKKKEGHYRLLQGAHWYRKEKDQRGALFSGGSHTDTQAVQIGVES